MNKKTVLWGTITWSEIGKQNLLAKTIYFLRADDCFLFCLFEFLGHLMRLGSSLYYRAYGAFTSPPVSQDHGYCYLTFYYILEHIGYTSLTVFIEDNIGQNITTLWKAEASTYNWTKKVLQLPKLYNYSVVFLGYIRSRFSNYYVCVDDIKFSHCNSCKFLGLFACLFVCWFISLVSIYLFFLYTQF